MEQTYPQIEASREDLEVVEDVTEYLRENYTSPLDQGPIWLTGSFLHVEDPGDYDVVVQRDFQEVPTEADQRVVAKILNEFQQEDIDHESGLNELNDQLEASEYVDTGKNVNFYPEPVRRFQLEIEEVPVDLSFNNERPVDEAWKIL